MTSAVEYVQSGYWVNGYAVGDGWVTLNSELQSIAPSAIIELFMLELNAAQHGTNATYRFHAGTNATGTNGDLVWAGNTYSAFPVEAEGFEFSGKGQLPRPKIRVSNIFGTITALMLATPLEAAKVTRIRTQARYLDNSNWPSGVNPYGTPDPSFPEWPREVYFIDRKASETRDVVEFELCCAFDLATSRAPKRQLIHICQWQYKSAQCTYTGGLPTCGKTLSECKAHFGANSQLPFGGFPSAGAYR
jgi:lambda family phage minor tail protein L